MKTLQIQLSDADYDLIIGMLENLRNEESDNSPVFTMRIDQDMDAEIIDSR